MNTEKKSFPGSGQFDRYNSTYMHQIFFTNNRQIQGYSKNANYPEMQDKIVCLERVIERLYKNGYLDGKRTVKIDFYKNAFLDRSTDLIVTLYPDRFVFGNNMDFVLNEQFNAFLFRLYQTIKEKKIITSELSDKPKTQDYDNLFSLEYKRFKTEDQLQDFIIKMKVAGHSDAQLLRFHHGYKEKFF